MCTCDRCNQNTVSVVSNKWAREAQRKLGERHADWGVNQDVKLIKRTTSEQSTETGGVSSVVSVAEEVVDANTTSLVTTNVSSECVHPVGDRGIVDMRKNLVVVRGRIRAKRNLEFLCGYSVRTKR
jgi:hypothetical protein